MSTSDTRAGDLPRRFAERFELHELLGRGGMAAVYRATELGSGRQVAIKQLLQGEREQQHKHLVVLFEREFHTLAQLSHPRVIQVYDYGVTPDGTCYYTMELLDGGSLRDRVPLPWREASRVAFEVCSSLALLHSRRLLHRDVSPRNVHCTASGDAKLIDFGAVACRTCWPHLRRSRRCWRRSGKTRSAVASATCCASTRWRASAGIACTASCAM